MDHQMYQCVYPFRAGNKRSDYPLYAASYYFGHITRRGDDSLEKLVIVGNVEGKRSRPIPNQMDKSTKRRQLNSGAQ